MSADDTLEALDRELTDQAAQARLAIAAEQTRVLELEQELARAAAWNLQLRAELDRANVELRFLHRFPVDLPRLAERPLIRFVIALVLRWRNRSRSTS